MGAGLYSWVTVRLRSIRRTSRPATVAGALAAAAVAVAGSVAAANPAPAVPHTAAASAASVPRLVVPDLIAAGPGSVTAADLARLRKLSQVRSVLPVDGARITVNGKPLTVISATASALRPWTPPATAASATVWRGFAAGDLITDRGGGPHAAAVSRRVPGGGGGPDDDHGSAGRRCSA